MARQLNHTLFRNPYHWTIQHENEILMNDDQNLSEDKFFILFQIKRLHLNYYDREDGKWTSRSVPPILAHHKCNIEST
ncbi:hypothetical protein RND71_042262 [Anisodus tanguticus]|uniref:Uncharacterized protein n=1 Tax=Anisodus tanguticus TaxID=243964 RepID=A0AAE1QQA9_9SOLA|nr:hypothetical protein RND71_042262 [Anisodus tanguticus]